MLVPRAALGPNLKRCVVLPVCTMSSRQRRHGDYSDGAPPEASPSHCYAARPSLFAQFYGQSSASMWRSYSDTSVADWRPQQYRRQCSDGAISRRQKKNKSIPQLRRWEDVTKVENSGFQFTLMCYNVLAQDLIDAHRYLYSKHNQNHLEWNHRWDKLWRDITSINPDILCLQEVQESHLRQFYDKLKGRGYRGIYKKRTHDHPDGCAIYYKAQALHLVENVTVEYHQPGTALLNRDNIAIIARFSPTGNPEQEFVVATTHLLYNPKREDIRLAQAQVLLAEVDRMAFHTVIDLEHSYLPTIITGDLNSIPESNVYKFITQGRLGLEAYRKKCLVPKCLKITDNSQHEAIVRLRGSAEQSTLSRDQERTLIGLAHSDHGSATPQSWQQSPNDDISDSGCISHNFPFRSVYNHFVNGATEATTYQDRWQTVDYIFYSGRRKRRDVLEDKLRLVQRYRLPLDTQLGDLCIPNQDAGSDHMSIAARFKLLF